MAVSVNTRPIWTFIHILLSIVKKNEYIRSTLGKL